MPIPGKSGWCYLFVSNILCYHCSHESQPWGYCWSCYWLSLLSIKGGYCSLVVFLPHLPFAECGGAAFLRVLLLCMVLRARCFVCGACYMCASCRKLNYPALDRLFERRRAVLSAHSECRCTLGTAMKTPSSRLRWRQVHNWEGAFSSPALCGLLTRRASLH